MDITEIFQECDGVVGIDLAAKPHNETGFAILKRAIAKTMLLKSDDEIINHTLKTKPSIIAIDAPLSLPEGDGIAREADRLLVKKGFRCFWPLLPSMKPLTLRGIKLKETLEKHGLRVIEVFPSATQKILRVPTKKAGKDKFLKGLAGLGINITTENPTHHELDAVTAALTVLFYLAGRYEAVGDEQGGLVILPQNPMET